jgi:YD repeat-containing protein
VYSDAGYAPYVATTTNISSAPSVQKITTATTDGLGRKTSVNVQDGTSSGINTSTTYDGLSRVYQQSSPYRTTSDATYGLYTHSYDALSRPTITADPDSNFSTYTYSGYSVTYTDESHHVWTRTYDALGRLLQVLEPNSSNVPTFVTAYTYDALNDLKTVTQNGNSSSGDVPHSRQFSYNGLGQLQSATNPESGTINYFYDLNGNLSQTVDANNVTVTYGYDALNRLLSKTFAGGNTTLPVGYDYDSGSASGGNYIGRLADEYTGSHASPVTKRVVLGYDADGRETGEQQCLLGSCASTSPVLNYNYDLAGDISSWTINVAGGGATITNTYDAADRLASVSSNYSGNPASPTVFDTTHPDKLFSAESSNAYGPMGLANPQYGILTSGGVNGQAPISGAITYDKRARVTSAVYMSTGATQ